MSGKPSERDTKKTREKIESIRKREENRRCALCTSRSNPSVCFDFGIFVCSRCGGLLHDVARLVGNKADAERYLRSWTPEKFPIPSDRTDKETDNLVKKFIEKKYIDKIWEREAPVVQQPVQQQVLQQPAALFQQQVPQQQFAQQQFAQQQVVQPTNVAAQQQHQPIAAQTANFAQQFDVPQYTPGGKAANTAVIDPAFNQFSFSLANPATNQPVAQVQHVQAQPTQPAKPAVTSLLDDFFTPVAAPRQAPAPVIVQQPVQVQQQPVQQQQSSSIFSGMNDQPISTGFTSNNYGFTTTQPAQLTVTTNLNQMTVQKSTLPPSSNFGTFATTTQTRANPVPQATSDDWGSLVKKPAAVVKPVSPVPAAQKPVQMAPVPAATAQPAWNPQPAAKPAVNLDDFF